MTLSKALSPQVCLRRIVLLVFILSCFLGRSCGFQVHPTSFRKQRHVLAPAVHSARSSFVSLSTVECKTTTCMSIMASRGAKSYRQVFDCNVSEELRLPLFQHSGHDDIRLYASSNDDEDQSPTSDKIRTFISKIFKRLASPVKKIVRWIRSKFQKTDEFLEETIEEQETAIEKAIADMKARANEVQAKAAALASEQSMLDKTDPTAPKQESLVDTVPLKETTLDKSQVASPSKAVDKKEEPTIQVTALAPRTPEMVELLTQEEKATAEAQSDTADKVEVAQNKDAALTSDTNMLDKLDETEVAVRAAEMNDLIEQEQVATAEAQTEIVEKMEDKQTMDAALATEERMLAQLDKPEPTDADIMTEMKQPAQQQPKAVISTDTPSGDRWAISSPDVDLSGEWKLIVTEDFKSDYDEYLKQLGQPFLVRSVALTLIGLTTEYTEQKEEGRTLFIRGTNARGIWERTLITSGADKVNDQFTPLHVPVDTADDERVEAEAWWEEDGTAHISWMRGLKKYGGGDFESKRYLDNEGKVLVCESTFHPNEKDRKDVGITWRFLKNGETLDS